MSLGRVGAAAPRAARAVAAVTAALVLSPLPAAGADGRAVSIFADPLAGGRGQHATAVEPDSFAWGDTVVAVFQVGRIENGGADAIGWATSHDGGRTWRSGLLPGLTAATGGPAPFTRVSDPAVAYDRLHGTWLVSVLALEDRAGGVLATSIVTSRSRDGVAWEPPVTTAPAEEAFAHDKNWLACDNGEGAYRGRCYTSWTHHAGVGGALAVSTSTDGGVHWSRPLVLPGGEVVGVQPVVRPNGDLVIPHLFADETMASVLSRNGGQSFEERVTISDVRFSPVPGVRASALPSAEVARDGRVWVAWTDCRFRPNCLAGPSTNDIVLVSSADGTRWTTPRRVPLSPPTSAGDRFVPGLAVDSTSAGARTRLAVAAYARGTDCAGEACPVWAEITASSDGGRTWSRTRRLSAPRPVTDVALARGRMLGDYISTSWSRGHAVPIFSAPVAAFDGRFHQEILAAVVTPPPFAELAIAPGRPRAGAVVRVTLTVSPPVWGGVTCAARIRRGPVLPRLAAGADRGRARCSWRMPRASAGHTLTGSIALAGVRRSFAVRVTP